jgi:UDP-GlcNAc3NAcA epimerase
VKKILSIIGARPQFIKHAPIQLQLQKYFTALTLHTGQHYDSNMSAVFFNELNIPQPDYLFNIGRSKPQGEQTGIMMAEIEKVCLKEKPDAVLVYGDTNSTLAGTLAAVKMCIPLIHIEAGLRSYNRQMPEEINRIIADEFASLLFCPTKQAIENLKKEGISHDNIFLTGDVMCDMICLVKDKLKKPAYSDYYFATIHRPYNTDDVVRLAEILKMLNDLEKKIIFSVHPRTLARMQSYGMYESNYTNIIFIPPVGYIESISFQTYADAIITDSGGIQKEAYILKKKCITLRSETEWTETLQGGWNTLVFENLAEIGTSINKPVSNYVKALYGTGNAAVDIVEKIKYYFK